MKTLARLPGVGHFRDGDCFIQSIVNALAGSSKEIDYKAAEAFAKSHHWDCDNGIKPSDWESALEKLGFSRVIDQEESEEKAPSVKNTLSKLSDGRYIVHVHGHLFAFVHGVAFDDGRHVALAEPCYSVWKLKA